MPRRACPHYDAGMSGAGRKRPLEDASASRRSTEAIKAVLLDRRAGYVPSRGPRDGTHYQRVINGINTTLAQLEGRGAGGREDARGSAAPHLMGFRFLGFA